MAFDEGADICCRYRTQRPARRAPRSRLVRSAASRRRTRGCLPVGPPHPRRGVALDRCGRPPYAVSAVPDAGGLRAFVSKHLARQLARPLILKTQARSHHLVRHREQNWFRLKPDLLIRDADRNALVPDTKWKLLDSSKANGTDKYRLSQGNFYQLQACGQSHLDVVLIYQKTAAFDQPLPVFEFPKSEGLLLWVLPFCLTSRRLAMAHNAQFAAAFADNGTVEAVDAS